MHDWVVWCNSKKWAEEIRSFQLSGKEICSNYHEKRLFAGREQKEGTLQAERTIQVVVEARLWWKQGNIKMAVSENHASCWVHKDFTVTTKQI